MKKLCSTCRKKLDIMFKDHLDQQKADSQSSTDAGGLSQGSNFSSTSQGIQAETEQAIDTVNNIFEELNLPPVNRERYIHDKNYEAFIDASIVKKLKLKLGKAEVLCTDQVDISSIMLANLKENIKVMEKFKLIEVCGAVLPKDWSISKIQNELDISRRMAQHIKLYLDKRVLPKRQERSDKFSSLLETLVRDFWNRLDVSRELPDTKRKVKVKDTNGSVVEVQMKLMLLSGHESYLYFKELNPEVEIGETKFLEFKPVYIKSPGQHPDAMVSCLCKHHENPRLAVYTSGIGKLEGLEEYCPNGELRDVNSKDLMYSLLCPEVSRSEDCWKSKCDECISNKEILQDKIQQTLENENIENVSYDLWVSTDRAEKVTENKSAVEFSNMLVEMLNDLKLHHFISKVQYQAFLDMKENLGTNEAICVGDFSENFTIQTNREIQSAYYSHDQVTIHPWMLYYKDDQGILQHKSVVMLSDELRHDTVAVSAFQKIVVADLKRILPSLTKINFWSDGCAAQYKNKVCIPFFVIHVMVPFISVYP